MEKIVVTGMGLINALGKTVSESWQNIVRGKSGIGPITLFDASDWMVNYACEIKDFDPADYISRRDARRMDRYEQLAMIAAQEAMNDSGLVITPENASRVGVLVTSAIGGLESLQNAVYTLKDEGPRRVNPFVIPMMMPNGAAGLIAIRHGAKGPAMAVTSACASGNDSLGLAWSLMRSGVIDVAIAGASEATICAIGVGAFARMGALSQRDDYSATPQPFDSQRDGLVMGEGAAILILETESHARARGAHILAEFAGYAASADAHHITAPAEDGEGGARAMQLALESAGLTPTDVDYINAHGTGTPLNDAAETAAIKAVFGEYAYKLAVSSTKSMTGHMMGATGAVEAVYCVKAIQDGILPPTINYRTPDPVCDLDYVPNEARQAVVRVAMSNAFGFGGHNAVIVMRKYE
ncbi:MAG: beta-ketoacyl-ACP synthase II [Anaerolineales bacterium]